MAAHAPGGSKARTHTAHEHDDLLGVLFHSMRAQDEGGCTLPDHAWRVGHGTHLQQPT